MVYNGSNSPFWEGWLVDQLLTKIAMRGEFPSSTRFHPQFCRLRPKDVEEVECQVNNGHEQCNHQVAGHSHLLKQAPDVGGGGEAQSDSRGFFSWSKEGGVKFHGSKLCYLAASMSKMGTFPPGVWSSHWPGKTPLFWAGLDGTIIQFSSGPSCPFFMLWSLESLTLLAHSFGSLTKPRNPFSG